MVLQSDQIPGRNFLQKQRIHNYPNNPSKSLCVLELSTPLTKRFLKGSLDNLGFLALKNIVLGTLSDGYICCYRNKLELFEETLQKSFSDQIASRTILWMLRTINNPNNPERTLRG